MGHNRNLADYAHHFDGTNIDLGSGNIETEGVLTYEDVTNVDAIGIITARAGVKVPDSQNISLGTGNDFAITHDGTNTTFINDTGQIQIRNRADDQDIILQTDDGSGGVAVYLRCDGSSGQVDLNHYGSRKFYTSSTGATVNGTLVSDSVTSELDLSATSSSISDTAVHVFVYDTRKDSDGGAWRKRTQYTSWYNETLNTSTRGSRKEFPAVAVIVTETGKITIYDGDDPDLPMWMVFNVGTGNALWYPANSSATATVMLNGKLANAAAGGSPRFRTIDFLSDSHLEYSHTDGRTTFNINISQRNAGAATGFNYGNVPGAGLIHRDCNDVAITVLPNAPIDDATGLPVPTIAVATDGGVSVIKDDGTVVDIRRTSDDDVHHVALDGDRVIMFMELGAIYVATIPSSDQSGNPNSAWSVYGSYGGNTSGTDHPAIQAYGPGLDLVSMKDHTFATAGYNQSDKQYKGLSILSENVNSSGNGMVAWIHSDFNTGYMHGDIKGAFLSDTDTTNATSGEILTNGDFTNGTTGWTIQDAGEGSISSSSNQLTLNNSTSADPPVACYQQISLEVGKYYNVISSKATGLDVVVNITTGTSNGGGTGGYGNVIYHQNNIEQSATFLATQATMYCYIRVNTNATGTAVMNFVSIRKAEEDRSINSSFSRDKTSALTIYGTVTKSAVATGADLVAYSGFSASNHLAQPYNSNLNPGSGSYSVVAWFKTESNNSGEGVITGLGNADTDEVMLVYVNSSYGIYFDYGTSTEYVYLSNSNDRSMVRDGNWHQVVCQVTAGQIGEIYIDGIKKPTAQNVAAPSTWSQWDTNYRLYVGCGRGLGTLPFSGSISLVRYSLSNMSTEQIKKIYEDEKVLFQENAKATLYGSSDAVTALAYDEDSELLHVGTSSGRSDFQGLRRINNTTTAVTTAISASDELIAEQ
jgi:hypothetical protein